MSDPDSIFFQFNLPNPTTWFYFSLLLAVALFFKFTRLLSMRNLDIVILFLPVPGLLLLLEAQGHNRWWNQVREFIPFGMGRLLLEPQGYNRWWGYVWLMGVSGYLLFRCLWDLALVRRPALSPNLNTGGLGWLGGALFVSLVAVAARAPGEEPDRPHKPPPVAESVQEKIEGLSSQQIDKALWVDRTLAVFCHLSIVTALVFVGWRHFQDVHAGMAAATFYLLLPYTYLLLPHSRGLPGQWYHVWPMAVMVWAVVLYRRPTLAGLLLGVAAGSVGFPALVLPVWLSFYWRRGCGRFLAAFLLGVGLCLVWLAILAWFSREGLPRLWPLTEGNWLPWGELPQGTQGLWRGAGQQQGVPGVYRLPVFVAYLALLFITTVWPYPKNLAHVLALSAALLIGTQFWYADQGGVYVLWYLPLLLLLVFRPNLSDCRPPPIVPETDWLCRAGRRLGRLRRWLARLPEQTVKAQ
jgi:hypothetical protein